MLLVQTPPLLFVCFLVSTSNRVHLAWIMLWLFLVCKECGNIYVNVLMVTSDKGGIYTWGSNKHHQLGRECTSNESPVASNTAPLSIDHFLVQSPILEGNSYTYIYYIYLFV